MTGKGGNVIYWLFRFFKWFFGSPSYIIAFTSAIIAFFAYKFQKNQKRKYEASKLALLYINKLMPSLRFISYVLYDCNFLICTLELTMNKFDHSELSGILKQKGKTISDVEKSLNNINLKQLTMASSKSNVDFFQNFCYNDLTNKEIDELCQWRFEKYVIDFLNELEAFSLLLRYNISDEKILYQSLHQTFLRHFNNWYYFISKDNYLNEDRFYDNLIWLYKKWNNRKLKESNKVSKFLPFKGHNL